MLVYREAINLGYSRAGAAIIQTGAILTTAAPVVGVGIGNCYHQDKNLTAILMGVALAAAPVAYIAGVHFTKKMVDVFSRGKVRGLENQQQ